MCAQVYKIPRIFWRPVPWDWGLGFGLWEIRIMLRVNVWCLNLISWFPHENLEFYKLLKFDSLQSAKLTKLSKRCFEKNIENVTLSHCTNLKFYWNVSIFVIVPPSDPFVWNAVDCTCEVSWKSDYMLARHKASTVQNKTKQKQKLLCLDS